LRRIPARSRPTSSLSAFISGVQAREQVVARSNEELEGKGAKLIAAAT